MDNIISKVHIKFSIIKNNFLFFLELRKHPKHLKRSQKFNTAIEIHKSTEARVREYTKRLTHYIVDLEKGEEPFQTWEELGFCLINPLKNLGEQKPHTFSYLNNGSLGIIGYLEHYQEDRKKDIKGIPVIEMPLYASFLHQKMSSTYLEYKFKISQIDNIKKKNKNSGIFTTQISTDKAIKVLERESRRILSSSDNDSILFGGLEIDFSPTNVFFRRYGEKLIPYLKKSSEEVLADIKYFTDGNYEVWSENNEKIQEIVLKNGEELILDN